jgi:hypothetical protein
LRFARVISSLVALCCVLFSCSRVHYECRPIIGCRTDNRIGIVTNGKDTDNYYSDLSYREHEKSERIYMKNKEQEVQRL